MPATPAQVGTLTLPTERRNMDSDIQNKAVNWIGGIILMFVFFAGVQGLVKMNNSKHVKMAELGYEQATIEGHSTPVWVPSED